MITSEFSHIQPESWNEQIAPLPGAHVLQSWEWGQVKSRFGWQPLQQVWRDEGGRVVAAALVLQRSLSASGLGARLRILYVPKGPLLDWGNASLRQRVLSGLANLARRQAAIFVKIDPDVILGRGVPGEPGALNDPLGRAVVGDFQELGWRFSEEQIQFQNTVLIDLTPDLDRLLAKMKQKTRYNIRLAGRKGVTVRVGNQDDLGSLYRMYVETSARDGFVIRDEAYYQDVWGTFIRAGLAEPIVAEVEGEMAAAVVIFRFAGKAWYLYGMSRRVHREKMPNYLLQWEAMRRAKENGSHLYDLWGAPNRFDESDPLWGVFRFKDGFGGQVVRHIGAWDLPVRPVLYRLYTQILPRLLDVMRRRGKARTRQVLG